MAAQGAFGTDFYDRSTITIVGTMLSTEYRPAIKIGPKGTLGSHEIRPIHSAPSLGQSVLHFVASETSTFFLFQVESVPEQISDEFLTCIRCGTYGLVSEFVARKFCGRVCKEEHNAEAMRRQYAKCLRKDKMIKLTNDLMKQIAYRVWLVDNKMFGFAETQEIEVFRAKMKL